MSITILPAVADQTFSFKAGMNLGMHYGTKSQADDYEVHSGMRYGAVGGLGADLIVLPYFSLAYEILYSMKGSVQDISIQKIELDGVMETLGKPAQMHVLYYIDYLEIPMLFKVAVLDNDFMRLKAITGSAMSLKLKGRHELRGTIYLPDGDDFTEIPISEKSKLEDLNLFDFSFCYGGSLEFKRLAGMFLEYRFTLGWDYLSLPTFDNFAPVELRNQAYSLMLGMKF